MRLTRLGSEGAFGGKTKLGAVFLVQTPVGYFLLAAGPKLEPSAAVFDLGAQNRQEGF